MSYSINHFEMGIDEAGRGPLVGDVFAAAVVLNPNQRIIGLNDSKKLSAARRASLRIEILDKSYAFGMASASVEEIDRLNILQATLLAMRRAAKLCQTMLIERLDLKFEAVVYAKVDGNRDPQLGLPTECIVKGDSLVAAISAASILAKTERDASMEVLHQAYPQYGFNQHKGYGTAVHLAQLKALGPLPFHHRQSFAPMRTLWK